MIAYFARHPTTANLLMGVMIVLGLIMYPSILRETFPDITPRRVEVRVVYPGASAEEIEESVCQRIEDAIDGVESVVEVSADAREGLATVTVEMEEGGSFVKFKDDITSEIEAINDFPDNTEDPVVTQLGNTDPVLTILVTGPLSTVDMKAYCEQLKDRLQRLDGVALIDIGGFSDHQFRVELSAEALRRYGLSVQDVADVVGSQNSDSPAGGIEGSEQDLLIRVVGQRRSPAELEQLVIRGGDSGAEILLRDVGTVVDVFELDEAKTLHRDERCGKLTIRKTKQQDSIRVADTVKEFLVGERERFPQLDLFVSNDGSTLVLDRILLVLTNGWQGMLLVFFTLWLFFSWRLSFWVAMSLPVSFLGALALMPYLGLSINMLTLVGMLMALGLLMDDGIVIAENIAAHRARGKSGMQAAIDGITEVQAGVFSSFVTTLCVLGPLAFISGDIGKVLGVIPVILIVVLAISLIEAYMILPSHLGHALAHGEPTTKNPIRVRIDGAFDWLRESVFGRLVDVSIRWRYMVVGSSVGLLIASSALVIGGFIPVEVFPSPEGDVVTAKVTLPAGTPLRRTEEVMARVTQALRHIDRQLTPEQPDEANLVESFNVDFNQNDEAFETGPHVATVTVDLLGAEIRTVSADDIIELWKTEIGELPDVMALTIAEASSGPAGRAIEVRVQGDDLAELKLVAAEAMEWFRQFRGITSISDDLREGKPEYRVRLRPGAMALGLNATSLSGQLRAAFQGITADEIQIGPESYEVDVRLARGAQDSLADLDQFLITLADGKQVPIETVATIERTRGWSRIARIDGMRTVTIRGDTDSRIVSGSSLVNQFRSEAVPMLSEKYPGAIFDFEGESAEGAKTMSSMLSAMFIGLIGVFVLLSFQFESYLEPGIVMSAIPMALIGVFVGHALMGIPISLPGMLGFISLAGVVVNDSILLVLFLKNTIASGADVHESAAQASRQRFRAIMLTSATTVAGLMPLMFETSGQALTLVPLAVSIAFGIMASTVLVLVIIPCIYVILADFGMLKAAESHEST